MASLEADVDESFRAKEQIYRSPSGSDKALSWNGRMIFWKQGKSSFIVLISTVTLTLQHESVVVSADRWAMKY
jgi:hypothetical protein